MIDLKQYKVTTALPKKGSKEARTFQAGEDLAAATDFLAVKNGRVRQWAPTTGAATESVHRTRCEIVGEPFYAEDSEQSVSDYTWQADKVNYDGEFVFQQVHCDDGNDPTFKAFGELTGPGLVGRIKVGIRTGKSKADPKKEVLVEDVDFSKPLRTVIKITKDGVLTFAAGGETITKQLDDARLSRPHVFHWGPYNQVNMGDEKEPKGDGTLIWSDDIVEYHGPAYVDPGTPQRDLAKELEILAAYPTQQNARDKLVEISAAIKMVADAKEREKLNARAREVKKLLG